MRKRLRIKDPSQPELPLSFVHLLQAAQGKAGDHLDPKASGGMINFRCVVLTLEDRKKIVVGTRIKVSLGTRCKTEAMLRRDICLAALQKAGVLAFARVESEIFMEGQPGEETSESLGPADSLGQPWRPMEASELIAAGSAA